MPTDCLFLQSLHEVPENMFSRAEGRMNRLNPTPPSASKEMLTKSLLGILLLVEAGWTWFKSLNRKIWVTCAISPPGKCCICTFFTNSLTKLTVPPVILCLLIVLVCTLKQWICQWIKGCQRWGELRQEDFEKIFHKVIASRNAVWPVSYTHLTLPTKA